MFFLVVGMPGHPLVLSERAALSWAVWIWKIPGRNTRACRTVRNRSNLSKSKQADCLSLNIDRKLSSKGTGGERKAIKESETETIGGDLLEVTKSSLTSRHFFFWLAPVMEHIPSEDVWWHLGGGKRA